MLYCVGCGKPCHEKFIDEGIGSYEFWGIPGYDSRPALVSDCCEDDIQDDEGRAWTLADAREEAEDAAAEAYRDALDDYDCDYYRYG